MFLFYFFADHSSIFPNFDGHVIVNEAFIQIVYILPLNRSTRKPVPQLALSAQGNSVFVLIYKR